jgi:DedD protein
MAEAQDVNSLRRRGRRRLVGAIALVLLAVIVLPMVFDAEPRRDAPPVSVRIPSEDSGGFSPKVTPRSEPLPAAPAKPAPPKVEAPQAEPAKPERAEQYVVQVGAFVDPADILEKLAAAGVPHYTEPVATAKGRVMRVRAGPFAGREAAEKARGRLKDLGLKPGSVVAKP